MSICKTLLCAAALALMGGAAQAQTKFAVSFPAAGAAKPLDGRIILLVSRDFTREPRSHVEPTSRWIRPIFRPERRGLAPGRAEIVVDERPSAGRRARLSDLPAGDYYVQAVLNRYETFHLRRRPHPEAAAGQGRGPALGRTSPATSIPSRSSVHIDPSASATDRAGARPGDPADRAQDRHRVRPPHPHPQRAAVEVLGPRRLHRRPRAVAQGLRQASRGALSADGVPRPFPGRHLAASAPRRPTRT